MTHFMAAKEVSSSGGVGFQVSSMSHVSGLRRCAGGPVGASGYPEGKGR